jgi:hypothetical protein
VDSSDPVAIELVHAIQAGDTGRLGACWPGAPVAAEPIHDGSGSKTPLHWAASSDDAEPGGQRRAAELFLSRGADINTAPGYSGQAPVDAAAAISTRRENLVTWLRDHGARTAEQAT